MVTEQEALELAINYAFDNSVSLDYLPDSISYEYYTGQFEEMITLPDGMYYSEDSGGEYYSFIVGINDQYFGDLEIANLQNSINGWSSLLTADNVPQEEIEEAQEVIAGLQQQIQQIQDLGYAEYLTQIWYVDMDDRPYPFEAGS